MGKRKARRRLREAGGDGNQRPPKGQRHVYNETLPDPAIALLVHSPEGRFTAVAVNTFVRLYDHTRGSAVSLEAGGISLPIRCLALDSASHFLLAGGDDKCAYVWEAATGVLLGSWQVPKKVSAAAFSPGARFAFVADKYGDVYVFPLPKHPSGDAPHGSPGGPVPPGASGEERALGTAVDAQNSVRAGHGATGEAGGSGRRGEGAGGEEEADGGGAGPVVGSLKRNVGKGQREEAVLLLGHFCSIVTSLGVSGDGRYIVSTDRDNKVRVSILPMDPMQGCAEIEDFCLGHTAFVTCCAFLGPPQRRLLVTGGGDGTLRLWDYITGRQHFVFYATAGSLPVGSPTAESEGVTWEATTAAKAPKLPDEEPNQAVPLPSQATGVTGAAASATEADGQPPQEHAPHQDAAVQAGQSDGAAAGLGGGPVRYTDGGEAGQGGAADVGGDDEGEEESDAEAEEGEGGGDGDAGEEDRGGWPWGPRVFQDLPPAVLAVAATEDGCRVAAILEGEAQILLLKCVTVAEGKGEKPGCKLREDGRVVAPGIDLPSAISFDSEGNLWVAGGASENSPSVLLRVLRNQGPDGLQPYEGELLPRQAAEFLEACPTSGDPVEVVCDPAAKPLQVNQQLKKRSYKEEEMIARKTARRDVRDALSVK
eukprot:jgi/Botrbrau1/9410/Bobra.0252s0035.1